MRETLPLMTFRLREDAVLGRQRIQHYFQQLLHHQVHSMNILIDATRVSLTILKTAGLSHSKSIFTGYTCQQTPTKFS